MNRWRILALALGVACAASCGDSGTPFSTTTPLGPADCGTPPPDAKRRFEADRLDARECPGLQGWRVFVVSSGSNAWLELRSAVLSWSSEDAVVFETPIGLFPAVDDTLPLEWRIDGGGSPTAVIFRIAAQDPANPDARVTRLFVARLSDTAVCLLGRSNSPDDARALADGATSCDADQDRRGPAA